MISPKLAVAATAFIVAVSGSCSVLSAQALEPGKRVRLYPESGATRQPFVGTIASMDANLIVLRSASTGDNIELPVDIIEKYEVSLGKIGNRRSVWDGIKKGAIIGTTLGLAGGALYAHKASREGPPVGTGQQRPSPEYAKHMKRGVLYVGSSGALIGAITGWRVTERWSPAMYMDGTEVR